MIREGVILFLIIVTSLLHANSDIWWNDIALLKKKIFQLSDIGSYEITQIAK